MSTSTECVVEFRPIHETIVASISRANSTIDMSNLAYLIKRTLIPKNHDAIIEAWKKKCQEIRLFCTDLGVPESVLRQKRTAERKLADAAEACD